MRLGDNAGLHFVMLALRMARPLGELKTVLGDVLPKARGRSGVSFAWHEHEACSTAWQTS